MFSTQPQEQLPRNFRNVLINIKRALISCQLLSWYDFNKLAIKAS